MNKNGKSFNAYFIAILILLFATFAISLMGEKDDSYTKAELVNDLKEGNVSQAVIQPNNETPTGAVRVTLKDGQIRVVYVSDVKDAETLLAQYHIDPVMKNVPKENWFISSMLPMLIVLIIGVFFFVMMNAQNAGGGGGKMANFGKSRARLSIPEPVRHYWQRRSPVRQMCLSSVYPVRIS